MPGFHESWTNAAVQSLAPVGVSNPAAVVVALPPGRAASITGQRDDTTCAESRLWRPLALKRAAAASWYSPACLAAMVRSLVTAYNPVPNTPSITGHSADNG